MAGNGAEHWRPTAHTATVSGNTASHHLCCPGGAIPARWGLPSQADTLTLCGWPARQSRACGRSCVLPACCLLGTESGPPVSPFHFLPHGAHRGSPPSSGFLRQCAPRRLAAGSPRNLQRREERAAENVGDPGTATHSPQGLTPDAPELRHTVEALGALAGGWGRCYLPASSWLCSKGPGDGALSLGGALRTVCTQQAQEGWSWQVEHGTSILVHL